ncbi:hypothetical protein PCANC_14461 [Puccinia coronata f. sp. avenae]|uniref:CigA protein n=1 Tax=Puccinia coronata f. sp. avenae TaxID=200324 RepID=A0A2N5USU2_9BASI|nr:hypothetical protein PCANC_14461 [Puccinia coronata f. sp. avenae]
MLNQNLPPYNQSKVSPVPENQLPSRATVRGIKRRTARRILIVITIIASTAALVYFPPWKVLYTWTTARPFQDSSLGDSSVTVNVEDGSLDWQSESHGLQSPSLNNNYRPKSNYHFDEVLDRTNELPGNLGLPIPSFRLDKTLNGLDEAEPRDSHNLDQTKVVPIFDRLVVKEPPNKPYKPLARMRTRPEVKYENVRPSVHYLTRELESTKFLTFLPHSGFHNQRVEMNNAFKLAKMLNRTLILPPFRLGNPLRWDKSALLSQSTEQDERKYERLEDCLKLPPENDGPLDEYSSSLSTACKYDSGWTSVQVDYLLDIKELYKEVPVIDRTDLREDWLWNILNLYPGEWLEVQDDFRYSYQIYESSTASWISGSKYSWRLNIDQLSDFSDVRLLSFGSLFGSERVIINSPEMESFNRKIEANQMPNLPLLEKISDRISDRLGGRGKYIGIHLRVAEAFFKAQAPRVIREIFEKICKEILQLDQKKVDVLITQNEPAVTKKYVNGEPRKTNGDPEYRLKVSNKEASDVVEWSPLVPSRISGQSSSKITFNRRSTTQRLKCKGKLYKHEVEKQLVKLNVPIYISTDLSSKSLEKGNALNLLFANFPCVFTSNDLKRVKPKTPKTTRRKDINRDQLLGRRKTNSKPSDQTLSNRVLQASTLGNYEKIVPPDFYEETVDSVHNEEDQLVAFHHLKSSLDGADLDRFLFPILELMIVSKGSHFIGTPKSTFSSYAENILFPVYQRSHIPPSLQTVPKS